MTDDNYNKMSGPQIEKFREGWALFIMGNSKRVHHYKRDGIESFAEADCGYIAPVRWLYHEGNWPRCKRCTKAQAITKKAL